MFGKVNENKKLTFWVIGDSKTKRFFTITLTREQSFEYLYRVLAFAHMDHFKSWCGLKNLDYKTMEAQRLYFNTSISDAEKDQFFVAKVFYTIKEIAGILRMFGGCNPLGCSFDTEAEYAFLKDTLEFAQKTVENLEEAAKEKDRLADA